MQMLPLNLAAEVVVSWSRTNCGSLDGFDSCYCGKAADF